MIVSYQLSAIKLVPLNEEVHKKGVNDQKGWRDSRAHRVEGNLSVGLPGIVYNVLAGASFPTRRPTRRTLGRGPVTVA